MLPTSPSSFVKMRPRRARPRASAAATAWPPWPARARPTAPRPRSGRGSCRAPARRRRRSASSRSNVVGHRGAGALARPRRETNRRRSPAGRTAGYGSGRSSTDRTTVKSAVFAPMQTASVRMAARAKPRSRQSMRRAKRRSCQRVSMRKSLVLGALVLWCLVKARVEMAPRSRAAPLHLFHWQIRGAGWAVPGRRRANPPQRARCTSSAPAGPPPAGIVTRRRVTSPSRPATSPALALRTGAPWSRTS